MNAVASCVHALFITPKSPLSWFAQNRLSLPGEKFSLAVFSDIGGVVCTFWENWRHPFSGVLKIDVTVFYAISGIWAILGISHTPKIGPQIPAPGGIDWH